MYISRLASDLGPLPFILGNAGIAAVPNIYSQTELDELNAVMTPFFAQRAGESRAYVRSDDMVALGIFHKILSPAMQDVFFSIMPDPVIYHMLASEIAAGKSQSHIFAEQPGGWHRDPDSGYFPHDPTHVSVTVYLSDVGPGDGAFEIVPQLPELPLTPQTPTVSMTGNAGRSFVWHRSYYHRAAPNTGPVRRRIIKFSIQRNAFTSAHLKNQSFRRVLAEVPAGDPRVDLLLGRYQGGAAPILVAERPVSVAPVPPTGTLGAVAAQTGLGGEKATYVPRDASDLDALPDRLAEDGVARLPDIYTIAELAEINAALNPLFKAKAGEARANVLANDLVRIGIFDKVVSPAMKHALYTVLPDPVFHHFAIREIANGADGGAGPGEWRKDADAAYFAGDPTYVSVFVYLSDVGAGDGALEVLSEAPDKPPAPDSPVVAVIGSAGLSFACNRGFRYREHPNTGARRRRMLQISVHRRHFNGVGLRHPSFVEPLAKLPEGDALLDALLGRKTDGEPPDITAEQRVLPHRLSKTTLSFADPPRQHS